MHAFTIALVRLTLVTFPAMQTDHTTTAFTMASSSKPGAIRDFFRLAAFGAHIEMGCGNRAFTIHSREFYLVGACGFGGRR